jgi:hypothetical protein
MITLVTLTLSSPHYSQYPSPTFCSTSNSRSKRGESKTLAISSSLRFLFLGAKFVSDNLTLDGEVGESGGALVSENIRLEARILTFQKAKDRVEAREVNQGIVVQVETQILTGFAAIC